MRKGSLGLALLLTFGFQFVVSPTSSHAFQLQDKFVIGSLKASPAISKSKISDNKTASKKEKKPKKRKSMTYKDYVYDPNRPDIIPPVRRHKKSDTYS